MQPQIRKVRHYFFNGKDLFQEWLCGLKDLSAKVAIVKRIGRVMEGNFGDRRYVGEGVWELRVHYGPGYRIYYGEDGPRVILLICGGDKGAQQKGISRAIELWAGYKRGK